MTDRRDIGIHNEYGITFGSDDLAEFFAGFVIPSGVVDQNRVPRELRLGTGDVLVNVRRGDYFANAENRLRYSFDLNEYLVAALGRSEKSSGPIDRILVVSDGISWCQENLQWLAAHCNSLLFEDRGLPSPIHLALLANSPRLILANSTFSYWGGYLSTWRYQRPLDIVAPWFHVRDDNGGAAWQLDPRWAVVKDIPSGWRLP